LIARGGLIYKRRDPISEIGSRNSGPPGRGKKSIAGNKCCGSENSGSLRLGEVTITWQRDLTMAGCLK